MDEGPPDIGTVALDESSTGDIRTIALHRLEDRGAAQRYGSGAAAGQGRLVCMIAPLHKTRCIPSAAKPLSPAAGVGQISLDDDLFA